MEYFINCNSSTLAPYTTPLDELRAAHLYRRLGFSASVQTINAAVGQTAGTLIDNLVDQALATPAIPAPEWADWNNANYPEDDDLAIRGAGIRFDPQHPSSQGLAQFLRYSLISCRSASLD